MLTYKSCHTFYANSYKFTSSLTTLHSSQNSYSHSIYLYPTYLYSTSSLIISHSYLENYHLVYLHILCNSKKNTIHLFNNKLKKNQL